MNTFSVVCLEEYDGGSSQITVSVGAAGKILVSSGVDSLPNFQEAVFGQNVVSVLPATSAVGLTSNAGSNITSISLDAGTYAVDGMVVLSGNALSVGSQLVGISTTSSTMGTVGDTAVSFPALTESLLAAGETTIPMPRCILTLEATTTVYLVAQITFSLGTLEAYGKITAVRIQ